MRRAAVLALVATLLASSAFATTTLVLRNGKRVEGEIVSRNEDEIRIKVAGGKVETYKVKEIDHLEEPPPAAVVSNETGDARVDRLTKDYERRCGFPLATTTTRLIVVRGDQPQADLKRIAEAAEKTARHFLATFGAEPEQCVPGDRYGPGKIEIVQLLKEDAYLAFCDGVLARIRDESVDDARLAFMKRERGFWIVSPRAMMAQYQGPSDLVTSISAACHKTSHVLLTGWKPSGDFRPWWFYEGLASWQEFAVLGETRTYCIDLERPDAYGRSGSPGADEAAKARSEDGWKRRVKALLQKRDEKELGRLGKMTLNELVLVDVQQSWSVVDWLHRTGRLKDFGAALKETRDLAAACTKVLGVPVASAHQEWRAWALRTY